MDLRALDADCEALRAAAAAAEGVLARQDVQLASMSVAWHGAGAQASRDFLRRHGEASAAVVAAVRTAAESLTSLRDRLWHSVDGKVAATMATQNRGARPDWRAAAQTVTTGAGDRAAASELVDQEVKPFVDNEIRSEWLTAMRSAMAAVTGGLRRRGSRTHLRERPFRSMCPATSARRGRRHQATASRPHLQASRVPLELLALGRCAAPAGAAAPGGAAAPAGASPAWSAPPAAAQLSAPPPSQPLPPPVDPAAMTPPSLPSMGGGMPEMGSGLSGFGGQLGDLLGGLMGTSQDALSDLPEPDELDEPDDLDPLDEDDPKTWKRTTGRRERAEEEGRRDSGEQEAPRPSQQPKARCCRAGLRASRRRAAATPAETESPPLEPAPLPIPAPPPARLGAPCSARIRRVRSRPTNCHRWVSDEVTSAR